MPIYEVKVEGITLTKANNKDDAELIVLDDLMELNKYEFEIAAIEEKHY